MRRLAGQAALHCARGVHLALEIVLGAAVVATIATGALIWRLSQGPIDLRWLTPRLDTLLNEEASSARLHIGSVALAWEGWRHGVDRPLDLRLNGVAATDANGKPLAQIPQVELSLSFGWLLLGRIVPRAIEVDGAHVHVERTQDGSLSIDLGRDSGATDAAVGSPLAGLLAELMRPRQNDRGEMRVTSSRWSQLRRVRLADADFAMVDRRLGMVWRASHAELTLQRHREGGVTGSASLTAMVGDQPVQLALEAVLPADGSGASVQARFSQIETAALARTIPALAPLDALQAPVQGTLHLDLGPGFRWRSAAVQAQLGGGAVRAGAGTIPFLGATLTADGDPDHAHLRLLRLVLTGPNGAAGPVVQAHGEMVRKDGHLVGQLEADMDRVPFADLARYWPVGGAAGARNWVTRNVTAGTARAAHVTLALQADEDGSDITLQSVSGHISGDDLTIHWLRPVPPLEHVKAELALVSVDTLVITTQGGRQAGTSQGGGIVARDGTVKVTGMMEKDQYGAIDLDLAGSVADTLALLRQPRLHLLDRHPIELHNPSGQVMARLSVKLWLDERVTIDQIAIRTKGQLSGLHLGGVLAGRDLDDGLLDLAADNDGLRLDGSAELGGLPAELGVQMDFRAGPPTQVLRRYTVSATTSTQQLAKLGIDPGRVVAGPFGLEATVLERRNGTGEADIRADLRQAELAVARLGWRKPPGQPADGTARILLNRDRITGIDRLAVQGGGDLSLDGAVDYAGGQAEQVRLDRIVLGDTRGAGEVRLPASGQPLRVTFTGSSLDLSNRLVVHAPGQPSDPDEKDPGRPWIADLRFGRVMLGKNRILSDVSAHAESNGRLVRQARLEGRAGSADHFVAAITPEASGGRGLTIDTADAGALLRTFNILGTLEGGTLALAARYDDSAPGHPLTGTADISSFRLQDAPAAARVLEAMTLYGLAASLRGPGLGVSRLIAPFRLSGDVLELDNARAFSPSLGFTAKGRIDLDRRVADVQGTIVPAYFFNSLLGRLPVLGTLFSPEKGGGVFSATYHVQGRLDDPTVSVNPLAALTPGFLRGLFGIFEGGPGR